MSTFKPNSPFNAHTGNQPATPAADQLQPQTQQPAAASIQTLTAQANPLPMPTLQAQYPAPVSTMAQPTPPAPASTLGALTPTHAIDTDADIARELAELQLPAHLIGNVRQLVGQLDLVNNPAQVSELGRQSGSSIAGYADHILQQVKQSDMGEMGDKLGEVVVQAKSLNLSTLSDSRSKVPLFGGLIDKFNNHKEGFVLKFQSVDQHIQKLMKELNTSETTLVTRNQTLEQMFNHTLLEFEQLGVSIVAGKIKLAALEQHINQRLADTPQPSPQEAQAISDLKQLASRLDKRVGDLNALQMSAMQTLPMIRMIQHNNQTLVEKFHNVRELTLPAWKRQFMLAVSLIEQKKAADLAQTIDDSTNEFLRKNAELLKQTSISTARINQRAVIDVETLEQVQRTLISTIEEVQDIHRKGFDSRRDAEVRIRGLQQELKNRLTERSS
ncbi:MAG: hypothetical protein RLY58_247 [Pseudomonadota bacterium]|jgi:uncharacterized protein YaaN involved in tellurite resistance